MPEVSIYSRGLYSRYYVGLNIKYRTHAHIVMSAHNVRAILRIHILFLSSFHHIALAISHV